MKPLFFRFPPRPSLALVCGLALAVRLSGAPAQPSATTVPAAPPAPVAPTVPKPPAAPAAPVQPLTPAQQSILQGKLATAITQLATATGIKLIPIPAGTFTMGSPMDELDRTLSEGPETRVTLTKDFFLGATDVTQSQYAAVIGTNPSGFTAAGPDAPVENVSWDDAMAFCKKLNERESAAGHLPAGYSFTLPTEAQWEYACRADRTTTEESDLDAVAWYVKNSGGTTHPAGTKLPNPWGLYDMEGNVMQWCYDLYAERYPGSAVSDPTGPATGSYRVGRGGRWDDDPAHCRFAARSGGSQGRRDHVIGFRVALIAVPLAAPKVPAK